MLPKNLLIIDIATASQENLYSNLSETEKEFWDQKNKHISNQSPEESYTEKASMYSEFGKIIGIGMGKLDFNNGEHKLYLKTIQNENETKLIEEFFQILKTKFDLPSLFLCAHNGKEFDYPYICRRAIINNILLPSVFNLSEKKSWNIKHLDTMQMWKFGDYKSFTPLELIAHSLGIKYKEKLINGSSINELFHKKKNKEIQTYLEEQIVLSTQVLLKLKNKELIEGNHIKIL